MELEDLVSEAKNGSEEAAAEIVNRFRGFIYKTAREIFIKGYDLEDLLQIGYTTLIKCIMKYDGQKNNNFTSYAVSSIKNNYFYEIRQTSRYNSEYSLYKETSEGIEFLENLCSDQNIEEDYLKKEQKEVLVRVIKKLKPEEQELIEYVYFKNGKLSDYARLMDIKYVTCIKLKQRILKKLKDLIVAETYCR